MSLPDRAVSAPGGPEIAVIVPHYNDPVRLEKCLAALVPQVAAAGAAAELVVIDNDSPCDLAPVAAAYPAARFVTEPEKGAAAARNRGVAETTAPGLAFLDSDCVPAADWLATAHACTATLAPAAGGGPGVVGGRIDTFDETPPPRSGAEAFETVFAFHQRSYVEDKGFSASANLLTTRAVYAATGPMVVGLSEDVDWCRRAVAAGFALVYDDRLAVAHPTRRDWPALRRKWRRTTDEAFHLNGTRAVDRAAWLLRAAAVAGSALVHLPRLIGSPKLSGPRERLAGGLTLLRLRLVRCGWMLRQALTGH